ncbi:hypothetical protein F5Y08DRAFT_155343 [Xylaria arbuscula]|nr:hypothetical protein F5Y08DRAFT_155343 [Xylaria arbuscula]
MDLKKATTRLRRTFAYPSDTTTTSPSSSYHADDSDSDPDSGNYGPALDEQEQEELIRSLAQQNAARNAQFRIFLLALPAISALPYLIVLYNSFVGLVSSRNNSSSGNSGGGSNGSGPGKRSTPVVADIWISLLALSSLASTAWTLWSLPPGVTGLRVLDAWVGSSSSSTSTFTSSNTSPPYPSSSSSSRGGGRGGGVSHGLLGGANAQRRRRASAAGSRFSSFWAHRSPLQQYLPFLNIALCSLLVLAGLLSSSSSRRSAAASHWGHVGLANLPALIYVVVLVAKMLMGSIDPERELSALRYEYKGA